MPDQHEELTAGWLGCVAEVERLLDDVVTTIASAPSSERERIARSFAAFVTGPRVDEGVARALFALAARERPLDNEGLALDAEVAALREQRTALEAQLRARSGDDRTAAVFRAHNALVREVEAKRQTLACLQQVLHETRVDASGQAA